MCDTVVSFKSGIPGRSYFGKNSDRDPGELQFIDVSLGPVKEFEERPFVENLKKYSEGPFLLLKRIFGDFPFPYKAVLSRPSWMWGAEMGINEKGVSIGNEAVFSKTKSTKKGLLGMDILRLALHNSGSAKEALEFIINLIEKYGQGGDGSYKGHLFYHNSFLITDGKEAFVLETSAKEYVWKKVSGSASISNVYTIGEDFDKIESPSMMGTPVKNVSNISYGKFANFKKHHESRFYAFFSRGNSRQTFTSETLKGKESSLNTMRKLLRSHMTADDSPSRNMSSICMHARGLVSSETTASFIVEYTDHTPVLWFTSSPYSCVSLYKPLVLSGAFNGKNPFKDHDFALAYAKEQRANVSKFFKDHSLFLEKIAPRRDALEREFEDGISEWIKDGAAGTPDCARYYQREENYLSDALSLINNS